MQKMSTTKARRLSLKSPRAFTQQAAAFFQRAGGLFCNCSLSSLNTPPNVASTLTCNTIPVLSAAAYKPPKAGDHGSEAGVVQAGLIWRMDLGQKATIL